MRGGGGAPPGRKLNINQSIAASAATLRRRRGCGRRQRDRRGGRGSGDPGAGGRGRESAAGAGGEDRARGAAAERGAGARSAAQGGRRGWERAGGAGASSGPPPGGGSRARPPRPTPGRTGPCAEAGGDQAGAGCRVSGEAQAAAAVAAAAACAGGSALTTPSTFDFGDRRATASPQPPPAASAHHPPPPPLPGATFPGAWEARPARAAAGAGRAESVSEPAGSEQWPGAGGGWVAPEAPSPWAAAGTGASPDGSAAAGDAELGPPRRPWGEGSSRAAGVPSEGRGARVQPERGDPASMSTGAAARARPQPAPPERPRHTKLLVTRAAAAVRRRGSGRRGCFKVARAPARRARPRRPRCAPPRSHPGAAPP